MFTTVSRRHFVGGLAAALGYFGTHGDITVAGQAPTIRPARTRPRFSIDVYDAAAKLAYNENPYGPSESVVRAMTGAFRFDNCYGYPDGDIVQTIADHHGVKPENLLLGAGSSEILQVAGRAFLADGRKAVGVEPTFADVYEYAGGIRAESIILPLGGDYRQDIPALVRATRATRANHRDVGFVYLCTPNNPTGIVVTKQEVRPLLDGVPEDVRVLIDEAYHHYVEHPDYVVPVIEALRSRGVLVGRPFPPMVEHLRVSVGNADEMERFLAGFREIVRG